MPTIREFSVPIDTVLLRAAWRNALVGNVFKAAGIALPHNLDEQPA